LKQRPHIVILFGLASVVLSAAPTVTGPEVILENYCAAARSSQHSLDGASMEVEIEATLPKLKKQGRLQALRRISELGRITYDHLRFEGDRTVKNDVIARYLTAETQAQANPGPALEVTPTNYRFKYKGVVANNGRDAHVFQISPRKKRVGLYRGEIWIDTETYLRVREAGSLVKNPSIFLKRVEFVRKYEIRNGISVPLEMHSVVDTRLWGKAELTVEFYNVALGAGDARASVWQVNGQ
jgi:hypothetical protein